MTIREVRAALGKQVRFRSAKLHTDGVYILSGCIIRRNDYGFAYQAELLRDNHITVANLNDIECFDGAAAQYKKITRQQADNVYDMLKGACNRLFVTDDPDEPQRLYTSALHSVEALYAYALDRLRKKEEEHEKDRR